MSDTYLTAVAQRAGAGHNEEGTVALRPTEDGSSQEEDGLHSVVLVGVTGDGKSSTGNTLCGRQAFAVSGGLSSATAEAEHVDYLHLSEEGAREMRVVDTIGLHDTGLGAEEVMRRFAAFADWTPMGIDVFLLIVRWGRFRPDHEAAVDAFVANCGEAALAHTVLVFTGCMLSAEQLAAQLDSGAPDSLRRLLAKLPTSPIGIDNTTVQGHSRPSLHAAVEACMRSNNGRRYSNAALAEARARYDVRREEERIAFAAAVSDWRKGTGPVVVEREC